jgi:cytochrome c oxidase cbb3-type subunit I/II
MSGGRHRFLEGQALTMTIMVTVLILIGGLVEIVPLIAVKTNIPAIPGVEPYSPLELEGRDLYIREGCYNCHSQMVRPFRSETLRYPGGYGKPGEFVYDHPFQFGSKRTGPDLLRVGGKYPDAWHYRHMEDPQETSAGSIMPRYPWLIRRQLKTGTTVRKLKVMRTLGVPYSDHEIDNAVADLEEQAAGIAGRLAEANIEVEPDREIIALIAYLQRLGTDARE